MKKKLLLVITVVLVLGFSVPAFAALTGLNDTQKKEIQGLQNQMIELRKQVVDKYVDAGQITKDEAKTIKDNIDQAQKYREENGILPGVGCGNGIGQGCGGAGCGGAGAGFGRGFGRGMGASGATWAPQQGNLQ